MMERADHLKWCKERALQYLDDGNLVDAVTSMLSDLDKHPETRLGPGSVLSTLGLHAAMSNDIGEARRFITGFN